MVERKFKCQDIFILWLLIHKKYGCSEELMSYTTTRWWAPPIKEMLTIVFFPRFCFCKTPLVVKTERTKKFVLRVVQNNSIFFIQKYYSKNKTWGPGNAVNTDADILYFNNDFDLSKFILKNLKLFWLNNSGANIIRENKYM